MSVAPDDDPYSDPYSDLVVFPNGGLSLMHCNWQLLSGALIAVVTQLAPVLASGRFGPKAQAIGSAAAILMGAFGVHRISTNAANAAPAKDT